MVGPIALATLITLFLAITTASVSEGGKLFMYVLLISLFYPVVFPLGNFCYAGYYLIHGDEDELDKEARKEREAMLKLFKVVEILGESLPQVIIAAAWLNHHGDLDECKDDYADCMNTPIVSLFFSVVSVGIGIIQGCLAY